MSALETLATFAAGLRLDELPDAVVEKAKACLLYGLAVGLASRASPHPARALAVMPPLARSIATGVEGAAATLADGLPRTPAAAAFCNAVLLHARIQEDAHPAGHVGVVVIPAVLAACEAADARGDDLLAALVAGYEVALRIGREHCADLSRRGFRTTPIYGAIGAAAAVSRARMATSAVAANAMALAANFGAGLREFAAAGSDEFAFQAGHAAQGALLAADLARAGVTAAASTLDGPAGFFRAFGGTERSYGERLAQRLGLDFEMLAVTYKPYPVCQFHRGIVRGALELRSRAAGRAVAALAVRLHPFEADFFGVRYAGPFASFPQTFMSAPFCAALAWARGGVSLAGLHDFAAADVLALVPRVQIVADASRARYRPHLEAKLSSGETMAWEEALGDEAYRLDWRAATSMARQLAEETGIAHADIDALAGRIAESGRGTRAADIAAATAALCCAPREA